MEGTLQSVKAEIQVDGTVKLLQPVDLGHAVPAMVTFLVEDESFTDQQRELIQRRSEELHSGAVEPISLDELKSRVKAKLA